MEQEGKKITVPAWAADIVLYVFRAVVITTVVFAWNTFIDVRDLKNKPEYLKQSDWRYEKKLLLVDHELYRSEIQSVQMDVDKLEQEISELRRQQR